MEQIHIKLGRNLKMIRQTRGLSLDKVAELTGVSKAMLGQIERGETSPTISIIWKIANGLRLSFTTLIEEPPSEVAVITKEDLDPLLEADGHYRVYPMFPFEPTKKFEVYSVEMDAGCTHESEAHSPGVEEYILVSTGTLIIEIQNTSYTVGAGSAVRYAADQPHLYRNPGEDIVRYDAIIYYP
ncbi:helix-turn-helix domain-containing protein [Paenibacillus sp. CF384]|uniref:helix-turn-helix domain-containing protein n=1 Tax=Paenibacillus sp. CF384 TaxID=1884382 RepID=UPI000894BC32|nr:XRE family transcriptional regulator [Paenibacillus sp. CF384]SDW65875.1 transcriptional regulator, XRE family with cupin sensor [Paenibacillus sp. CF384]